MHEKIEPGGGEHEVCCRCESLLPLLDKLVAARSGEVDSEFWNSMCKRGGTSGSGARTWFNGWFNILFPYIDRGPWDRACIYRPSPNPYCVPYSPDAGYVLEGLVYNKRYGRGFRVLMGEEFGGPDCEDFGSGMSCAPVEWDYLGQSVPLDFNAGFVGATQDPHTLQIRPAVGWFITHRPPVAEAVGLTDGGGDDDDDDDDDDESFHAGAATVFAGLASLKGAPSTGPSAKSARDMAGMLADTAGKEMQIKKGLQNSDGSMIDDF
eukprot:SAG31_NODE_1213_length_9359_cov_4.298164_9_plen_265_part_00